MTTKLKIGKLIFAPPIGQTTILESGVPFPKLQELKKQYISRGYRREYLKITY